MSSGAWFVLKVLVLGSGPTGMLTGAALRYDELEHDAEGTTPRAGGGRVAWIKDPDGDTFAIEADS